MGDGPGAVNLDPPVSPIAHTSQMLSDAYLFWRVSEEGQGHLAKTYSKLQAGSRTEAVMRAVSLGLIQTDAR